MLQQIEKMVRLAAKVLSGRKDLHERSSVTTAIRNCTAIWAKDSLNLSVLQSVDLNGVSHSDSSMRVPGEPVLRKASDDANSGWD